MVSENYKKWWRSLPPEAKQEVCAGAGLAYQYLSNLCSPSNTTSPGFSNGIKLLAWSGVMAAKFGTEKLSPYDIDTACKIKSPGG